ncbi:hypothetical protein [Cytobacillus massiliigabonensis]|uniref:hypothetical protein n=1 Tax=Cytobacillus massiliigabonensis TaxID=1871011 RepID=UPI000C84EC43|nr:hypothetical protein [Cytobacillus massiliigabonensis]
MNVINLLNYIFDFLLAPFNLFLMAISIVIVAMIMSLFFKTKRSVGIAVTVVVLGTILIFNQLKYTNFEKHFAKQLNEATIVPSITIYTVDHTGNRQAHVTIKNENFINSILEDLSDVKLKKDNNLSNTFREYHLSILTTNEKEEITQTESFNLDLDSEYINNFKIISDSNHLKTIELLLDSEAIDWIVD